MGLTVFICACTFLLTISNLSRYLIFAKVRLTVRHGCSIVFCNSVCRSHVVRHPDVVSLSSLDRYAISSLTSNLAFRFSCWWLLDGYHFPLEIATYLILPVSSPFELFLSIALSLPSIVLRFYRLHGWSSGTVPFWYWSAFSRLHSLRSNFFSTSDLWRNADHNHVTLHVKCWTREKRISRTWLLLET